jgi:hypothetical protein
MAGFEPTDAPLGFRPTHRVAENGLPAWATPDPRLEPDTHLAPGSGVQLFEQRPDGWAQVVCPNGWRAWVDGRLLQASPAPSAAQVPVAPPSPAPARWTATHCVGETGLPAWPAPDPRLEPDTHLAPGLDVQLIEQRPDGWAQVVSANGWAAWVDGRRLEAVRGAHRGNTPAMTSLAWMALVGGALVLVSAFAPWYRSGPTNTNASDIPLSYLLVRSASNGGPKVSFVLVPAALLILAGGAMLFTASRTLARWMLLVGAAAATNLAVLGFGRWAHPSTGLGLSVALPVLAVGGILAALAQWRTRSRSAPGAWGWLA